MDYVGVHLKYKTNRQGYENLLSDLIGCNREGSPEAKENCQGFALVAE